jgi:hypothetical protein
MSFALNLRLPLNPEPEANSEVDSMEDVGAVLEAAAEELKNPSAGRQRDRTRRTPTLSPPTGGYRRKKSDWEKLREQGRRHKEEWEMQHPGEHFPFVIGGNENDWKESTNEFLEHQKRKAEERYQRTKELDKKGITEESIFALYPSRAAQDAPRLRRSARIREQKEQKAGVQEVKTIYAPVPRKPVKPAAKPQGVQKKKAPQKSPSTKRKQPSIGTKKIPMALLEDAAPLASTVSVGKTCDDKPADTEAPKARKYTKSQQSRGKPKGVREKMSQPSNIKPKGVQKRKPPPKATRTKSKGP